MNPNLEKATQGCKCLPTLTLATPGKLRTISKNGIFPSVGTFGNIWGQKTKSSAIDKKSF